MKKLLPYLLFLLSLGVILESLHIWAMPKIMPVAAVIKANIPALYAYLLTLNGLAYVLIWLVWNKAFGKTGFAFLALSLIKLVTSVGVLYPYLLQWPDLAEEMVLHFMGPYFVFLLSELGATYRLLNQAPTHGNP